MPPTLKRFLVFAVCVFVAWYAHKPLLGAGFLGSDAAVLEDLDRAFREEGARALWDVDAVEHRPVAAASLALSRSFHATGGVYTPGDSGRLRLESLIILVIAAFGVRASVIRALRPWTGEDHARAAGAAAGALLMVHPLLVPVVAHLPARGDVVGLAASAWSVALLLIGRQERRTIAFGSAFLLAVVAAASSPAALLLVPLGFVLEFVAARRHRPFRERLKTALRVAAGYCVALLLELLVRTEMRPGADHAAGEATYAATGFDPATVLAPPAGGLLQTIGYAAEKVGVVVLPVNTTGVGTIGYVFAFVALLAALHPGFVAARAAPRLWGRVLGGWALAITLLLVLGSRQRTIPASLSDAPDTLALALTMAVGLGVSATALSGGRRTVLPVLAGGLYAILTSGSAATVRWAAAEVGGLHETILEAAREDGFDRPIWVLDPPRFIAGVEALAPEDEASLLSRPFLPRDAGPIEVRGIPATSFWLLAGEPEFERARARTGITLLSSPISKDAVPREDPSSNSGAERPESRYDATLRREVVRLDPPARRAALGPAGQFGWVADSASPPGRVFDPLEATAVAAQSVGGPDDRSRSVGAPVVRWLTAESPIAVGTFADGLVEGGSATGVWLRDGDYALAAFDLSATPEWLLSGTVKSLWFAGDLGHTRAAWVARAPSPLPDSVAPRVIEDDWTFDVAALQLKEPLHAMAQVDWVLHVVDPSTGLAIQMALIGLGTGRLVAEGAAVFHDREVVWVLDRVIEGVVTNRARGRRSPASWSVE